VGFLEIRDRGVVTVTGNAHVGLAATSGARGLGELDVIDARLVIDGDLTVHRLVGRPPDIIRLDLSNDGSPLVEAAGVFMQEEDSFAGAVAASITVGEDFVPQVGMERQLMTASAGLETLRVEAPSLNGDLFWALRQTPSEITLIALPAQCVPTDGSDDCDSNGIHDTCDVAFGVAADCNENAVPDTCEADRTVEFWSDYMTPFGLGDEATVVIERTLLADGDVLVTVATTYGTAPNQAPLVIDVNGTMVGELFPYGGGCGSSLGELVIPRDTFNGLIVPGEVTVITLQVSGDVEAEPCPWPTFIEAAVSYTVFGTNDRNHNGLVDDCEPPCDADITGPTPGERDGNVDVLDYLVLITEWGSPCTGGCLADITGPLDEPDGVVDALDLLVMIAQWGSPADCSGV
jgi:hypothetical protein